MVRLLITAALLAAAPASASLAISNFQVGASADPFLSLGNGQGSTTVVGETFVAVGDGVLHAFTFRLGASDGGNFAFELAGWDGATAVGEALYRTARQPYAGAGTYTFAQLGVALLPGHSYIAYLTASGVVSPADAIAIVQRTDDSYAFGSAFTLDTAGRSPLSGPRAGEAWTATGGDLAFAAVFGDGPAGQENQFGGTHGAVPEPTNWALLIAGFGLTGAALRRRRASFSVAHS